MTETSKDTTIPTITCPNCERDWPEISEQAVVYDLIGRCYACFINEVVPIRDERVAKADYEIENCSGCTGIPGAREKCTTCFGRGWVRKEGEGLIQLVK